MNFHKLQLIVLLKVQHFHIQFATSLLCGLYVSNVYDRILVFIFTDSTSYLLQCKIDRDLDRLKKIIYKMDTKCANYTVNEIIEKFHQTNSDYTITDFKCQIIEAHYILNSLHKPSVVFMVSGALCSYTYRNKYLHEGSER